MKFCDGRGSNLKLRFQNGPYVEKRFGTMWWQYYFERDQFEFAHDSPDRHDVADVTEQIMLSNFGRNLTADVAAHYVSMIPINKEILAEVSDFAERNFAHRRVIGVHYRGTDKVSGVAMEARRVPFEFVFQHLGRLDPSALLFVASDEGSFVDAIQDRFANRVCTSGAIRSCDGRALHRSGDRISMYRVGRESLIDCLLLSRCHQLIRTDSNLSYACRFFNVQQPAVNLTKEWAAGSV